MTIFYLNGTAEDKINDTLAYTAVSDVSPVYPVDSVGSKVVDGDFVDSVYSAVNPAYNNQKPTFYPFASNAAGQSIKIAGNTQLPHDNSATVVRVSNDASSVRSGLFDFANGKWDSTYVPTTNGYGLCENRKETVHYQGQEKTYSVNTTELTPCDQSTLVLPPITPPPPAPAGKVVRYGDAATDPSITLDPALYVGSMYLENNASTHPISISPFGQTYTRDSATRLPCNTPHISGLFIAAYTTLDNSITYFGAEWLRISANDYGNPANFIEFNPTALDSSYTTQAIIPVELRDKGPLKVDFYTNCNLFVSDFGHSNWDTQWYYDTSRVDITTRNRITGYSPELIDWMKTRVQDIWLEGYVGDGSEFNFSTWPDFRSILPRGRDILFGQCPNMTNHNIHDLTGLTKLTLEECPGFLENLDLTNFDLTGVSGGPSPVIDYYGNASGLVIMVRATEDSHVPSASFIEAFVNRVYQVVVIDQPFMSSHGLHLSTYYYFYNGYSYTRPPYTLSADTLNKLAILKAPPYRCIFYNVDTTTY